MLRCFFSGMALVGLLVASPAGAQQQPYTLDQVVQLVEGRVTTTRILAAVAEDCIDFQVDEAAERRILATGGDAELVSGLREICFIRPTATDPQGPVSQVPQDAVPGPAEVSGRTGMSPTAGALLAIPLPGVPLMTRPGPGPLVGVGVIGALGYLGYEAHRAYQDRERLGTIEASEPNQVADSVFSEKALTFAAAWVGQVVLTYYLWDRLGIADPSFAPYVQGSPGGRLNLGFQWTPGTSRNRPPSIPGPGFPHPLTFADPLARSSRDSGGQRE